MGRRIDAALYAAWRRRWERFDGSSVTVAEFCRREGVSQANFYQWRKRLTQGGTSAEQSVTSVAAVAREQAAVADSGETAFVELALAATAVVEIELPNGVRVRVPADHAPALGAAIRAAGELVRQADTGRKEADAC
jgi:transposase-like protein